MFTPNLAGSALNVLLNPNAADAEQLASVTLDAEISCDVGPVSAQFSQTVLNDVRRGDENTPAPSDTSYPPASTFAWRTLSSVSSSTVRQLVPNDHALLNAATAAFTVTLPASPAVGTPVYLRDAGATLGANPVTALRNAQPIDGVADDLLLDVSGLGALLIYEGGSVGWRVRAD